MSDRSARAVVPNRNQSIEDGVRIQGKSVPLRKRLDTGVQILQHTQTFYSIQDSCVNA